MTLYRQDLQVCFWEKKKKKIKKKIKKKNIAI